MFAFLFIVIIMGTQSLHIEIHRIQTRHADLTLSYAWNISRPWANVRLCEVVDYDTIISSDKSFLSEPTQFVAEGLMKWCPIKDKNNLFCSLRAKKLNWLSESGPDEIHSPLADVFNREIN